MAKQAAPARLTGGQGFNFEDCVAARFLLGLLGVPHLLGAEIGHLTRMGWQAADLGWRLEDLALTFGAGENARCVGVSIKNHKHVTESGFDESFTQACWEQWLGDGRSRRLRPDRDQMVLVTGVLAGGVKVAWDTLLGAAVELATAPERLVARLQPPAPGTLGSQSSEMQRALFQSLQCPPALRAGSATDDITTANLVRHIRLLHLDFESTPSAALSDGLSACRVVLATDAADQAIALWEAMLRVTARKRGLGGSIDLPELLSVLRRRFALKDHPDYAGEWERLGRSSRDRLAPVGLSVGGVARLGRRGARRALSRQLRAGRTSVVVGGSGVGKSALVRRLGEIRYRLVWLTSDLFHSGRESDFESQLGLHRPFAEVVAASPRRCLVVFDGVEGYNESGLQLTARLVASLRHVEAGGARIALTIQPEGLSRLRAEFAGAGVPADSWEPLLLPAPGEAAVERLLARCPGLAAAALRPEFRALLRNLKVFDWVVRLQAGGGLADVGDIVTLTALIDRVWMHFVERGQTGLARAALLKRIAGIEADRLLTGLPLSELCAAEADLLPSLEAAGLVLRQDERVRFAHDMFADWARLKVLIERQLPDAEETVRRAAAPGWFRAVRLYAQRLLELPGTGVERWQQSLRSLGEGAAERLIVRDLFLEALIVANDSPGLLRAAWPVLTAGDGALLHLLLDRFTYVGSLPDTRALSALPDQSKAAGLEHLIRVPFESYWDGVLMELAEHPADVIRCALVPTAKLLHFWLLKTRPTSRSAAPLRDTAAGLTLLIAREVQVRQTEGRGAVEKEVRSEIFPALLCSAPERPREVATLCLEFANRRPEGELVRQRREAAREEARRARERLPETNPRAAALLLAQRPFEEDRGPRMDPWPDGPRYRVDDAFRAACLDWQAMQFFAVNCPEEALEVLLAVLIKSPTYQNWARNEFHRDELDIADDPSHRPPFCDQGPFLVLFRCDPDFALTLVVRLVNFATERWIAHEQVLEGRYGRDPARGPCTVRLLGANGWVEYAGDKDVLLWLGGWRSHPAVVSSMLMALERWLYDETGAGRSVDQWVARIIAEGRSAALLGVLVQLGKFRPDLLAGPLRPLLSGSELYGMDEWRLDPDRVWQRECLPTLEAFADGANIARRSLTKIDAEGRERTATLFADHVIRVERQAEGRWRRALHFSGLLWLARWCRSLVRRTPTPPPAPGVEDDDEGDFEDDRDYPSLSGGVPVTWPGIEPHYLKAGFTWLEAAAAEEHVARRTVDTLLDLLAVTLRTVPASTPTRRASRTRFPSKFDEWLLERIAASLLRLPVARSAEDLWRPIIALGLRGEYWVKYFLSDFFQLVTRLSPEPEVFVMIWGQMIRCALDEPNWDTQGQRWNQGEEMVKDLLGFDLGKVVFGADERYARPVGRLLPEFERAAERWFHSAKVATGFCYFSIKPAGIELLLPGLRWLAAAESSWSVWEWENTGLADALVDLLRVALTRDRTRVAMDDGLRTGFISLCNKLVARGNQAALALRERVATH